MTPLHPFSATLKASTMTPEEYQIFIEEMPWDFDRKDESAVLAHSEKLTDLRERALSNPLYPGHQLVAHLSRPSVERERPLPHFAREEGPYTLVLRTPLETGVNRGSQVWTASVHTSLDVLDTVHESGRDLVVLKVLQPSMMVIPDGETMTFYDYDPPRQMAIHEDFMYRKLEPLQGGVVPYYYGMEEMSMPNGEAALVLIMEYIPGPTAAQWRGPLFDSQAYYPGPPDSYIQHESDALLPLLKQTFISVLESLREIHDQDVCHVDPNGGNMILYKAPGSDCPRVVFIDFETSRYTPMGEFPRDYEGKRLF